MMTRLCNDVEQRTWASAALSRSALASSAFASSPLAAAGILRSPSWPLDFNAELSSGEMPVARSMYDIS